MPKPPSKPTHNAAELIPDRPTIDKVRSASKDCQACDLWRRGTQTVFGEGTKKAQLMFVGEQPGNDEDLSGHPFVGPAGKLLDRALSEAGIDRSAVYVTNVVKHFKWVAAGPRRLHKKPSSREIAACLPWLEEEIRLVQPEVLVCLGATAAQALLGRDFRVSTQSGTVVETSLAQHAVATAHPSSILRQQTDEDRHAAMDKFAADLAVVAGLLHGHR